MLLSSSTAESTPSKFLNDFDFFFLCSPPVLLFLSFNLEVVSILINFGVDVNAKDAEKRTSLYYAFKRRVKYVDSIEEGFNILKRLMENGANPNLKDYKGESTIEKTLYRNSHDYFKAILYNQCKI